MSMNMLTAAVYWVIVAMWLTVIITLCTFYLTNPRIFGTTRLLLAVLGIDATRNIIENVYFGLFFGSKLGIFNAGIGRVLGQPQLLILPKLANIAAGCIVLGMLLFKWLPEAIRERQETERQAVILHQMATTDGMTGLQNRSEFMALTDSEWHRSIRYQRILSLAIIDIDVFKSINDQYGHSAGDQVIVMVSRLCQTAKRSSDIAGRLGGEEFGILLPETSLTDAYAFAERLRDLVAKEITVLAEGNVQVTISIGLSCAVMASSVEEFLKQADIALYEAKQRGRNRVCQFGAFG
jgi:diguanylate cyclase (GGDEF)-like protein